MLANTQLTMVQKHSLKRLDSQPSVSSITLEPNDARRLATLCGPFDEHLRLIEQRLNVEVRSRDNQFSAFGDPAAVEQATTVINNLYRHTAHSDALSAEEVHLNLQQSKQAISQPSHQVPKKETPRM